MMPGAHPAHGAMGDVSEQQPTQARPPQVSGACLIVMVGAVFVILLMWDRVADLHQLETRQALQDFLRRSDLGRDGIGVGGLLTTVKVVSMACAACAVGLLVQAWQAVRRGHGLAEACEQDFQRPAERSLDGRNRFRFRKGAHLVLQRRQVERDVPADDIGAGRQELPKLDVGRPEPRHGLGQPVAALVAQGAAAGEEPRQPPAQFRHAGQLVAREI